MNSPNVPDYYQSPRLEVAEVIPALSARILDVGCAAGALGEELKRRGAKEVVGLEKFEAAAQVARTRLDAVHEVDLNTLPSLPYPDGYFDVLVFADVLEHLVEPVSVLKHFLRYLMPDGRVILSLPNVRHESVVLPLLVDGRWQYQDMGIMDRTHLRFFTLREMVAMLRDAGLSPDARVHAVRSEPSAYLERACELVASLGGDVNRFRDEATAIQYVINAERPTASPWEGANPMRVLVCPDWNDASEKWVSCIQAFHSSVSETSNMTFGVVVSSEEALSRLIHRSPPLPGHVMAIAVPSSESGWLRTISESTVFLVTGDQEPLAQLAFSLNKEVLDGRHLGTQA
jgi:2-polyprenyl-3-methyl-5-hydroxy-6-metoxy-1,4-benzoquinol methylase